MHVEIEVSPGQLVDQLTILQIKMERITDEQKLKNIRHEYIIHMSCFENIQRCIAGNKLDITDLDELCKKLKAVNEIIWEIEDGVRNCERNQTFDDNFIKLARGVYQNNDERARLKRKINEIFESDLMEEKSYAAY